MPNIRTATKEELYIIRQIASVTYSPTYLSILGQEQVDYMLEEIYSPAALRQQLEQGHTFLIVEENSKELGFAAYSLLDGVNQVYKLQKIYVLPEFQGRGLGRGLITEVISRVQQQGGEKLRLNVNRFNSAKSYYEKTGFKVIATVDIPIGRGFFMNDYVMELDIPGN